MQTDDEGRKRLEVDVVELVDGKEHAGAVITSHLSELDEQGRQVAREVAGVRRPEHRLDVEADLDAVGQPEVERLQDAERPFHPIPDAALGVHREQHPAKRRHERSCQHTVFGHLDVLVEVTATIGEDFEFVE